MTKPYSFKFGVYWHEKKGFALAMPSEEKHCDWEIDKDIWKNHPIIRVKMHMVATGTGQHFFDRQLKGYEYWGEL